MTVSSVRAPNTTLECRRPTRTRTRRNDLQKWVLQGALTGSAGRISHHRGRQLVPADCRAGPCASGVTPRPAATPRLDRTILAAPGGQRVTLGSDLPVDTAA